MIDIIIPTYKNKEGLRKTLLSFGPSLPKEIKITVIDDFSETTYDDICQEFPFITILYNEKNVGPGMTRQNGIRNTHEPYIAFIDTGDTLIYYKLLSPIIQIIKDNPEVVVFSWQYEQNGKVSKDTHNRLHGRVYKREFLDTYGIEFCPESSYTNEDIGFNRLCRLIIADKNLKSASSTGAIISYERDPNSITNKNNGEFFFKQQNKGLALNSIHTIKIAEKDNVSREKIIDEVNVIMASLYYTFLCTAYERPEFLQEAFDGARLYFKECFSQFKDNTPNAIMSAYSIFVKRIYARAKNWKNFKPLNYTNFLKDLNKYETVPSWYIF